MPFKPHEWCFKFHEWAFRSFKTRSLRGRDLKGSKLKGNIPSENQGKALRQDFAISIECKNRVLIIYNVFGLKCTLSRCTAFQDLEGIAGGLCSTPLFSSQRGCRRVALLQVAFWKMLEGREPPLTLRQDHHYLYFGHFFPCTPGTFSLQYDAFFCRFSTEQVLYYRILGLYYGLASTTPPLYAKSCAKVKGGCLSCENVSVQEVSQPHCRPSRCSKPLDNNTDGFGKQENVR